VKLLWKKLQLGIFAGLTVLPTGCGGLHGSYSVSPKTILLPGLMKVEPKPVDPDNQLTIDDRSKELAQTQSSQINF